MYKESTNIIYRAIVAEKADSASFNRPAWLQVFYQFTESTNAGKSIESIDYE